MRSISKNVRRATLDMDIDFIRYPLSEPAIEMFVERLNCIDGIHFEKLGPSEELKQQDYRGKRIYIKATDESGFYLTSKIDLGVHRQLEITQEEYCFDIAGIEGDVSLLINSKEQMITEKLRSLLKFGSFSTRYKDIFDIAYLITVADKDKLTKCIDTYIFADSGMKENCMEDILKRITGIFSERKYRVKLENSRKNWTEKTVDDVLEDIADYLSSLIKK